MGIAGHTRGLDALADVLGTAVTATLPATCINRQHLPQID